MKKGESEKWKGRSNMFLCKKMARKKKAKIVFEIKTKIMKINFRKSLEILQKNYKYITFLLKTSILNFL